MTDFSGFELAQPILRALKDEGYTTPTPIQEKALPALLEGRDLVGIAQTGTGKTAAFALPLLNRLADAAGKTRSKRPQALILAPTRELASQIGDNITAYGRYLGLRTSIVFGGTSIRPQMRNLERGVHILVATPGRLLDLMNQNCVNLGSVEMFILDEADRMLDMGFIRDVRKIVATLPKQRQTAMFSATMPAAIEDLAATLLGDPVRVEATPVATTAERVEQSVLYVAKDNKRALLSKLLADRAFSRVLIFTRTKHGANRVAQHLEETGVDADAIHGNKSQAARQRALKDFRSGRIRALVATDIAARGIDVDDVTHVINFELPNEPESYVHRIGRTARAGNTGIAISFCDHEERGYLRDIEGVIRQAVTVMDDHPFHAPEIANTNGRAQSRRGGGKPQGGQFKGGQFKGGQRKNGQQKSGQYKQNGKPHGDRFQGDRAQGDRVQGDRVQGDKVRGDRPHGDRPHGDRPQGSKSRSDRSQSDRPRSDRPQGDRPRSGKPHGGNRPRNENGPRRRAA